MKITCKSGTREIERERERRGKRGRKSSTREIVKSRWHVLAAAPLNLSTMRLLRGRTAFRRGSSRRKRSRTILILMFLSFLAAAALKPAPTSVPLISFRRCDARTSLGFPSPFAPVMLRANKWRYTRPVFRSHSQPPPVSFFSRLYFTYYSSSSNPAARLRKLSYQIGSRNFAVPRDGFGI